MNHIDRRILALISAIVAVALVLLNAVAFRKAGFFADTADLIQQIIPNLIASLIAFLAIYHFLERNLEQRFSAINYVAELTSAGREYRDHVDRSIESILKLRTELNSYRETIRADIRSTLESFKAAQSSESQAAIDSRLRDLYSKLADAETRISNLDEKSAVVTAAEKDRKIMELASEITRLNQVIAANRNVARTIAENAKKI